MPETSTTQRLQAAVYGLPTGPGVYEPDHQITNYQGNRVGTSTPPLPGTGFELLELRYRGQNVSEPLEGKLFPGAFLFFLKSSSKFDEACRS
jgi:hypothetical protein